MTAARAPWFACLAMLALVSSSVTGAKADEIDTALDHGNACILAIQSSEPDRVYEDARFGNSCVAFFNALRKHGTEPKLLEMSRRIRYETKLKTLTILGGETPDEIETGLNYGHRCIMAIQLAPLGRPGKPWDFERAWNDDCDAFADVLSKHQTEPRLREMSRLIGAEIEIRKSILFLGPE